MYSPPSIQKEEEVALANFQNHYHHVDPTRFIYVTLSISTPSKNKITTIFTNHQFFSQLW